MTIEEAVRLLRDCSVEELEPFVGVRRAERVKRDLSPRELVFERIVPVKVENQSNARGASRNGWALSALASKQRAATAWVMKSLHLDGIEKDAHFLVTLTRVFPGRGRRMDDDNVRVACKHVRDEVAKALGRDDREGTGVTWEYRQERGTSYCVAVLVEVVR